MDDSRELSAEEAFSAFDRRYWLCRCVGFRVASHDGRPLGLVEELLFSSPGEVDTLAVRGRAGDGPLGAIPADSVGEVRPLEELVVLATPGAHP